MEPQAGKGWGRGRVARRPFRRKRGVTGRCVWWENEGGELPRMMPRFLDGVLPGNRVKARRERGRGWDTLSLAVVIMSVFAK